VRRRAFLRSAAAAIATGATRLPGQALSVRPRCRVIVDNDFSGDPDGLFQLAHHLASPSTVVPLVIGSHIHPRDFLDGSDVQATNAVRAANAVLARMRPVSRPAVVAGRQRAPARGAVPEATPAARRIIAEASRTDTDLPLFYAAGAGLTDLADALRQRPEIGRRMTLLWIGGPEHADLRPTLPVRRDQEYNITIDVAAAQTVFNASDVTIWQVPRDVYRTLMISHAELAFELARCGALGRYLLAQLARVTELVGTLGETYILGDSPLVTLSSLQSSFDPDPASSTYVMRPTPRITDAATYEAVPGARAMRVYTSIDTRLTFADLFLKLRAASLP